MIIYRNIFWLISTAEILFRVVASASCPSACSLATARIALRASNYHLGLLERYTQEYITTCQDLEHRTILMDVIGITSAYAVAFMLIVQQALGLPLTKDTNQGQNSDSCSVKSYQAFFKGKESLVSKINTLLWELSRTSADCGEIKSELSVAIGAYFANLLTFNNHLSQVCTGVCDRSTICCRRPTLGCEQLDDAKYYLDNAIQNYVVGRKIVLRAFSASPQCCSQRRQYWEWGKTAMVISSIFVRAFAKVVGQATVPAISNFCGPEINPTPFSLPAVDLWQYYGIRIKSLMTLMGVLLKNQHTIFYHFQQGNLSIQETAAIESSVTYYADQFVNIYNEIYVDILCPAPCPPS